MAKAGYPGTSREYTLDLAGYLPEYDQSARLVPEYPRVYIQLKTFCVYPSDRYACMATLLIQQGLRVRKVFLDVFSISFFLARQMVVLRETRCFIKTAPELVNIGIFRAQGGLGGRGGAALTVSPARPQSESLIEIWTASQ